MDDQKGRGRPRRAETDERMLRATVELLREKGPSGVSIDSVASRSGVARTTIYRRHASRRELIAAAIGPLVDRPLPPGELALDAKVRWVLDQVEGLLERGLGRGAVAAIVADSDPEFTHALRHALVLHLDLLRSQVESDIAAGLVAPDVDADALVGLLLGAYLGEVLRHGSPRSGWSDGATSLVTKALRVTPA